MSVVARAAWPSRFGSAAISPAASRPAHGPPSHRPHNNPYINSSHQNPRFIARATGKIRGISVITLIGVPDCRSDRYSGSVWTSTGRGMVPARMRAFVLPVRQASRPLVR